MTSPASEFQKLIYETLKNNTDLMGVVTDIYDIATQDATAPYISFGPHEQISDDAECITANVHTFQIDIWSEKQSKRECQDIAFLVKQAFHFKTFDLPTHGLSNLRIKSTRFLRDPDGITVHGVLTVTAIIEER